jgi:hypothetical protein
MNTRPETDALDLSSGTHSKNGTLNTRNQIATTRLVLAVLRRETKPWRFGLHLSQQREGQR